MDVPLRVREFRKALDQDPEGREYVLVPIVPRAKKYILTDKEGSLIRSFARHKLYMNNEDIQTQVTPSSDGGFRNYVGYAFKCSSLNAKCRRLGEVFDDLDKNRNGVLEPGEL